MWTRASLMQVASIGHALNRSATARPGGRSGIKRRCFLIRQSTLWP